jgi:hypothetical protein
MPSRTGLDPGGALRGRLGEAGLAEGLGEFAQVQLGVAGIGLRGAFRDCCRFGDQSRPDEQAREVHQPLVARGVLEDCLAAPLAELPTADSQEAEGGRRRHSQLRLGQIVEALADRRVDTAAQVRVELHERRGARRPRRAPPDRGEAGMSRSSKNPYAGGSRSGSAATTSPWRPSVAFSQRFRLVKAAERAPASPVTPNMAFSQTRTRRA